MKLLLGALSTLLCCSLSSTHTLDPGGRNVCPSAREPSSLVCCSGWRQEGRECTTPVCEGAQACHKDEVCVYPGVCGCPAGYYGAQCKTRCPPEFWAPDCRQVCRCHPYGRCHPVTGECTCNANRWGPLCQGSCKCARHGHCHPVHGNCTCDEGWWTPTCSKPCQCGSVGAVGPGCDQLSGRCQCQRSHWGPRCSLTCNCYLSPCSQRSGVCQCEPGWWGPSCDRRCNCDLQHSSCDAATGQCLCQAGYQGQYCNQACPPGKYGSGCHMSCGRCAGLACSASDGACDACEPGWNGTRCDRPCPPGRHGAGCGLTCPRCHGTEPCDPTTGRCGRCDPGWTGPRCEDVCSNRTFGDACSFLCSACYHGNCHHVTGRCVCQPGFQGESCNSSCPALHYGLNCSSSCSCGGGVPCNPVTGVCTSRFRGSVLAGVLVPLLLLLLAVLCCCFCCGGGPIDEKDRAAVAEGGLSVRIKYHVYSVLANIGAALPCVSSWSSGLPRVTVSHHDPELTFNHSFIEPPSSGWVTEGSSFDSDEDEAEALYCVPPREDIPAVAGGEFQEMSSKCNMFLDPSGFSSEDITSPFNIPRTSSIAKSKRPSVSFAEGTRFSPKERRGSAQDPAAAPGHPRSKPKWGVLMLSALQSQGGAGRGGTEDGAESEEGDDHVDEQATDKQETLCEGGEQDADRARVTLQVPGASGRRRTMSNAAHRGSQLPPAAPPADRVTTVYVTVGKAGRPASRTEPPCEGPVQAMLRRLGSLQRQKEQDPSRTRPKAAEVTKPPRKKLGARASAWEQGAPSGGETPVCKPIRRKHAPVEPGAADGQPADGGSPNTSSTPAATAGPGAPAGVNLESSYLTVGPAGDAASLTEVIANQGAEPCYENIIIQHS